jgi:DNA-binding NarL/FixJ family response regulator
MTLAGLTEYADTERYTAELHAEARENRDRAILAALTEGYTHTQIAEATGLTRGRIGQIANRKDKP